jgi:ligand-binding SRPBCC domain-containing protein
VSGISAKLRFVARSRIAAPADAVFRWHAQPGALERLTPPWDPIEIVTRSPGIRNGDRGALRVRFGPFRLLWVFEHRDYIEGRQFRDVQLSGPFRRWEHTHSFTPDGPHACILEDRIDYELPFGALGSFFAGSFIQRKLEKLFAYRHKITAEAMATAQAAPTLE